MKEILLEWNKIIFILTKNFKIMRSLNTMS